MDFSDGEQLMLVVSRKTNESITIEPQDGVDLSLTLGDIFAQGPIVLTLTHIGPRRVRILVAAPKVLKVMRSEAALPETSPTETATGELRRAKVG
jgi:sRNA-binding carbon storage regulator CsrA